MKRGKHFAFSAICAFPLILILPILAEAQGQCDPLTIAISGFNPAKEGGVLKLADDCPPKEGMYCQFP